jgi:hypothetical protein
MGKLWRGLDVAALVLGLMVVAAAFASASYAADTGTICAQNEASKVKLSPGLQAPAGPEQESTAHIQNITIKGVVKGCTGSTVTEANYVAHLRTKGPVDCSVLATGEIAEGTVIVKWRPKGQGNSHGTMSMELTGGATTIFGDLSGTGPFEGLGLYGPSTLHFGACPGEKSKLKLGTLTGSDVFRVTGPPHAKVESPENGGVYHLNEVVPTSFSCTEDAFGPGLASCEDSNGSTSGSGTLDTSTLSPEAKEPEVPGELEPFTYSVTAVSTDGQKSRNTIHYVVVE